MDSLGAREAVHPLDGPSGDFSPLLDMIGDARFVLLGEATHGTHEFYKARAEISKRLITEKGFTVIAWEADWPDAVRVNRYIRGQSPDQSALEALGDFKRFPLWMWRNADVLDLIGWLRHQNDSLPAGETNVGVYGLDLYSLYSSIHAVIAYLEKNDPQAAAAARQRYGCFDDFGRDAQAYGSRAGAISCEKQVVQQLVELRRQAAQFLQRDGRTAADEQFFAEQNARVAKNAEHYYRALYHGRDDTWNLRDTHMADTLDEVMFHLERQGESPKAIVWAHNSHLGDARATQMGAGGELNLGQLVRERHRDDARNIGFTTYSGTVTAASDWDEPPRRQKVRPALEGSYERHFHGLNVPNFMLQLRDREQTAAALASPLLERAIGVVYKPETERWSHYFNASLSEQFDAVIHFDHTRAVEPLETTPQWHHAEPDETFPTGF